jgi:seryl-tRNA synthetase
VVEKEWGDIPEFDFEPKDHLELAKMHDLIDMERGAKVAGSRFYYTKKDLVKLEFALVQYLFDLLEKKGFEHLGVPVLVNEEAMYGTGFFTAEKNEIYSVNAEEDNKFLIGTAEVPVASFHMNEILSSEELPKKYMAYSSCFRREAGSYGKDTKGVFRVHQFGKVEMFGITTEEHSWALFDELVETAEEILQRFELPYQKLNMCTGDISPQTAKKYDLEAWIPSQKKYRELVSGTNTTTYQSRRLNIRYKDDSGKKHFAHMLNCTAGGSMTRLFVALLENYQKEDGSIEIPHVLRPYLGGQEKIG